MRLLPTLLLFLFSLMLLSTPAINAKGSKNKKKSLTPIEKKLKNLKEEYKKTKCSYLGDDMVS